MPDMTVAELLGKINRWVDHYPEALDNPVRVWMRNEKGGGESHTITSTSVADLFRILLIDCEEKPAPPLPPVGADRQAEIRRIAQEEIYKILEGIVSKREILDGP